MVRPAIPAGMAARRLLGGGAAARGSRCNHDAADCYSRWSMDAAAAAGWPSAGEGSQLAHWLAWSRGAMLFWKSLMGLQCKWRRLFH